jgi:predicted nuclease of predicted toxin-antitoxin system
MPRGFVLDMGISPKVLDVLRGRGLTAVHVQDIGLATADDAVILDTARQEGAVVITSDKDLANHVTMQGALSPTVITLRLDNPTADEQIAALTALLDVLPAGALDACLITLERGRYRRRPLVP